MKRAKIRARLLRDQTKVFTTWGRKKTTVRVYRRLAWDSTPFEIFHHSTAYFHQAQPRSAWHTGCPANPRLTTTRQE